MNKQVLIGFMALLVAGCAVGREKIAWYSEHPEYLLKDPEFAEYRENLNEVERLYLNDKLSYAEYLERREALDDEYARSVEQRNEDLRPNEY